MILALGAVAILTPPIEHPLFVQCVVDQVPLEGHSRRPRRAAPVRFGVPIPRSARIESTHDLVVTGARAFDATPLLTWPEGTLRVVLIEALVDLPTGRARFDLHVTKGRRVPGPLLRAEAIATNSFVVDVGRGEDHVRLTEGAVHLERSGAAQKTHLGFSIADQPFTLLEVEAASELGVTVVARSAAEDPSAAALRLRWAKGSTRIDLMLDRPLLPLPEGSARAPFRAVARGAAARMALDAGRGAFGLRDGPAPSGEALAGGVFRWRSETDLVWFGSTGSTEHGLELLPPADAAITAWQHLDASIDQGPASAELIDRDAFEPLLGRPAAAFAFDEAEHLGTHYASLGGAVLTRPSADSETALLAALIATGDEPLRALAQHIRSAGAQSATPGSPSDERHALALALATGDFRFLERWLGPLQSADGPLAARISAAMLRSMSAEFEAGAPTGSALADRLQHDATFERAVWFLRMSPAHRPFWRAAVGREALRRARAPDTAKTALALHAAVDLLGLSDADQRASAWLAAFADASPLDRALAQALVARSATLPTWRPLELAESRLDKDRRALTWTWPTGAAEIELRRLPLSTMAGPDPARTETWARAEPISMTEDQRFGPEQRLELVDAGDASYLARWRDARTEEERRLAERGTRFIPVHGADPASDEAPSGRSWWWTFLLVVPLIGLCAWRLARWRKG